MHRLILCSLSTPGISLIGGSTLSIVTLAVTRTTIVTTRSLPALAASRSGASGPASSGTRCSIISSIPLVVAIATLMATGKAPCTAGSHRIVSQGAFGVLTARSGGHRAIVTTSPGPSYIVPTSFAPLSFCHHGSDRITIPACPLSSILPASRFSAAPARYIILLSTTDSSLGPIPSAAIIAANTASLDASITSVSLAVLSGAIVRANP